ncbi:MAG: acetyl-CoA C-acetyltransferase [Oceanicaulis sp.]
MAQRPQGRTRRRVAVLDGARTPFIKARGEPGPFSPVDLAVAAGQQLALRQAKAMDAVEEVILGCGAPTSEAPNTARVAALRMGLGEHIPAYSVQRNCGSGMQSLDNALQQIASGRNEVLLAGGTDALSHAPLELSGETAKWLGKLRKAKGAGERLSVAAEFRPGMAQPVVSLEKGLTDDVVKLGMGETAEVLAYEWDVSREDADAYAARSHHRLHRAQRKGWLEDEVQPVFSRDGAVYDQDDGVRPDTDSDQLSKLKAAFEKPHGQVTPGNSSQVTDGACWCLLASEEAAERLGVEPLGYIDDVEWAALDPKRMGLGPVLSCAPILKRNALGLNDPDLWEINEAFAAQVLACQAAFEDESFCREHLGLDHALGRIEEDKLNVDGGAVAVGHPVGASGTRIVLHALFALNRTGGKRAIATECIGGGQGGAMLVSAA